MQGHAPSASSGRQHYVNPVFRVEFDSPPSPPRTRSSKTLGLDRLGVLPYQDHSRAFPGGRHLEDRAACRLGYDGHDPLLLHRIHTDGLQHRREDSVALGEFRLIPDHRQGLEKLARLTGGVHLGDHEGR